MGKHWQQRTYCWLGAARYTRPLDQTAAKKWRAMVEGLGVPIYVIGFASDMLPRRFTEHARFYLMPQPPLSLLRYLVMFSLGPLLALWVILRHHADVLVAQSPYEGAVAALAKGVAALFGRRVWLVVENHGDFEGSVFMQRRVLLPGLYRSIMRTLAHYAFRHADALRAVSSSTHEQLARYANGQPIMNFMAWTDAETFLDTGREIPLQEARDIVYAGVLIPRKGIHILLEAFARLDAPESTLYLVGPFDNAHYTGELRQQAVELGIADRVRFAGGVPQAELARHLSRARAMVLPSLSEGLPRVIVEAMLCGTPVVATNVSGIPDVIKDGDNGYLVPPEDVGALLEALREVMGDADIAAMGQRARDFAIEFFSPQTFVNNHRALFELVDRLDDGR